MVDAARARFELGQVVATPGALAALETATESAADLLRRHVCGDWGDVPPEDGRCNDAALKDGSRILSAYATSDGQRLWIITDAEDDDGRRLATTILLPSEY